MGKAVSLGFLAAVLIAAAFVAGGAPAETAPEWSMNATIIEACSCPMFCQCYFNAEPAGHHEHAGKHFCKFNNVLRVNHGQHGDVKLDGVKFWVSGDLGDNFGDGTTEWAVVTFDRTMTEPQRQAVAAILGKLYPVKWASLTTSEGDIEWNAGKDEARATLDGGKTAEVHLKRFQGMTSEPVVIQNLKYFGAQRNDGFIMMPNVVEAYRAGDKAFEYRGTNGFLITFDIDSQSAAM